MCQQTLKKKLHIYPHLFIIFTKRIKTYIKHPFFTLFIESISF
ncbi:hypothetical protein FM109_16575 [Vibrio casei]|nr:hypothetical protein FM109_16575 [Vibrio casei]